MNRVRSCGVREDDQLNSLAQHESHRNLMRSTGIADTGQTLYISIQYYVIYRNATENLSLSLIQAQHQKLNMVFNNLNTTGLDLVPQTGRYAFKSVIGNSKIVYLPSNPLALTESNIIRLSYGGAPFDGSTKTLAYVKSQGFSPIPGVLNAFLAPLQDILGESEVPGNACTVEVLSVGGDYQKGTLPNYDLGMSLCHETGHCMSLTHTWNETQAVQIMPDIPIQKNPNYIFEFYANGARNCNRMKDCARYAGNQPAYTGPVESSGPSASWMCSGAPCTGCTDTSILFEMGCGVMDYATDPNMVMFSAAQCLAMRACLLTESNGITLKDSDGGVLTSASPADSWSNSTPSSSQNNPTSVWSKVKWYVIIGASVMGLLLLALIIVLVVVLHRRKIYKKSDRK